MVYHVLTYALWYGYTPPYMVFVHSSVIAAISRLCTQYLPSQPLCEVNRPTSSQAYKMSLINILAHQL